MYEKLIANQAKEEKEDLDRLAQLEVELANEQSEYEAFCEMKELLRKTLEIEAELKAKVAAMDAPGK